MPMTPCPIEPGTSTPSDPVPNDGSVQCGLLTLFGVVVYWQTQWQKLHPLQLVGPQVRVLWHGQLWCWWLWIGWLPTPDLTPDDLILSTYLCPHNAKQPSPRHRLQKYRQPPLQLP